MILQRKSRAKEAVAFNGKKPSRDLLSSISKTTVKRNYLTTCGCDCFKKMNKKEERVIIMRV